MIPTPRKQGSFLKTAVIIFKHNIHMNRAINRKVRAERKRNVLNFQTSESRGKQPTSMVDSLYKQKDDLVIHASRIRRFKNWDDIFIFILFFEKKTDLHKAKFN